MNLSASGMDEPLPSSPWEGTVVLRTESSPSISQSSCNRCCILGIPASWPSSRCFSSLRLSLVAVFNSSSLQFPSPSNWSKWVWYFLKWQKDNIFINCRNLTFSAALWDKFKFVTVYRHSEKFDRNINWQRDMDVNDRWVTHQREGLWVMVRRMIPASFARTKILPSTSMLTALVHSSRSANFGL